MKMIEFTELYNKLQYVFGYFIGSKMNNDEMKIEELQDKMNTLTLGMIMTGGNDGIGMYKNTDEGLEIVSPTELDEICLDIDLEGEDSNNILLKLTIYNIYTGYYNLVNFITQYSWCPSMEDIIENLKYYCDSIKPNLDDLDVELDLNIEESAIEIMEELENEK